MELQQSQGVLVGHHSPLDNIVAIEEAGKIYIHALHPKSFVSLEYSRPFAHQQKRYKFCGKSHFSLVSEVYRLIL
jgi:hypothetical protein